MEWDSDGRWANYQTGKYNALLNAGVANNLEEQVGVPE